MPSRLCRPDCGLAAGSGLARHPAGWVWGKMTRAAGAALQIEQRSVFDLEPLQPPGCIASNPPYGARLGSSRDFYDRLGTALRALAGHRVVLLAAQRRLQRALRLKPELARIVYNGDIQCRLLAYRIR